MFNDGKKKTRYENLYSQLDSERSSFMAQWQDLNDYILPYRGRFSVSDVNQGNRKNTKIYHNAASLAARTLGSGMLSGTSSPSRPWFSLTLDDPDLAEYHSAKVYLKICTERISNILYKSNYYNSAPLIFQDSGTFGTACAIVDEVFDSSVLHYTPLAIGSYMLGNDEKLKVAILFREFRLTVRQVIEKFALLPNNDIDWNKVSSSVKSNWDNGNYEQWVDIKHVVMPNEEYHPRALSSAFKKYKSCYYESGSDENKFLRESGYDYFPALCVRWQVNAEDIYGTYCPGMESLGDVKQLQLEQKKKLEALEKVIDPPIQGPSQFKNKMVSTLAGGRFFNTTPNGTPGLTPIYQINPNLEAFQLMQNETIQRINESFYKNLFLKLLDDNRRQRPTAAEVEELKREKIGELAPVLEQLNQDFFDPNINIVFELANQRGFLPPPPPEMQGQEIKVEYVSIMAQAQKMLGIQNLERFTEYAFALAKMDPNIIDKFDTDKAIENYADITSISPEILRTEESVQSIREQRARQQQMQAMAEQIQSASVSAKNLSQASLEPNNALSEMLGESAGGA